jgi:hypothetical protein
MHRSANPVDLLAKPRATGRCEARVAVLTERRRRCVHPAPILPYSGAVMRLGRPCVVGAVQVAPTPRIRPREVPRHGGSEARPSNLKLALVAYIGMGLLCAQDALAESGIIADCKRASGFSDVTLSTGQPLPAYWRRLVSLQAARFYCHACGMPASRWQQQACVWKAGSDGSFVRHHGSRCDLNEVTAPNGLRVQLVAMLRMHPACPLTRGRRDVCVRSW